MEKIDISFRKKTKRWLGLLTFCLIFLTGQMTFAQYCAPSSTDADYEWITNVTFAGINNTTGGNTGLNNYTGQTATVDKDLAGQEYTLSVSIEADSNEYLTVFIDWNQNGTLNDPGETYVLASATSGSGPFTIQVTVPAEAVLGSTRMRVILNYGGTPTPCTSPEYGEIEDYTVIVLGTPPACPAPTAFQVTGVTPATASLSWSGTGNFIVEYGLSGFTQGTGTEVPVSGTSTTLSPLTEGQAYQAYIVKDCGGGIKSAPVGPVS